ncbi:MAG: peptidylprolyl isomerase [Elusimicrobiota bacterium]
MQVKGKRFPPKANSPHAKKVKVVQFFIFLLLTSCFLLPASCLYGKAKEVAVIETDRGVIKFEFFEQDAPNTVANFKKLARKKFYNGLKFHRVVPNFVIQGGCPKGNGTGDPGYKIKAEFNKRPHLDGTVAMARAQDPDSAGSQFYICLGPQPFLDGKYTVFGQVIEGLDVVYKIQIGDVMKKVYIKKLKIKNKK